MYTFDHDLFSALNFDGGTAMDRVMLTVSGTAMWLPLYALILWLIWRHSGWRGMLIFTALMLAAIGLADMVSGIFKSNGVLGGLLLDFEPRPRPMFTPSLEGLDITPDSLRVMRREAVPRHWAVHVPPKPSAACTAPSRRTPRPSSRWPYSPAARSAAAGSRG